MILGPATTWKFSIVSVATSAVHIGALSILRLAPGDVWTVIDATVVTVGGLAAFNLVPATAWGPYGVTWTDTISLALDDAHDYWIIGYVDVEAAFFPAQNGTFPPYQGYQLGNQCAAGRVVGFTFGSCAILGPTVVVS
jgi:hypothetical protein